MKNPLYYPLEKVHREVLVIKGLWEHKHFALEVHGVGLINLIQYQKFIPHVAVCKVNT